MVMMLVVMDGVRLVLVVTVTVLGSLSFLPAVTANFNLYLTQPEVTRLLGLTAELYYVREGVVNDYAMNWRVPVPAQVHQLYFTWQALSRKPVVYNMAIWRNETEGGGSAMATPSVNISLTGNVPIHPVTFRLDLPCLGTRSAEVDIVLNINVTSPTPRTPPTTLYFKRRKICLKGQSAKMYSPHVSPSGEGGGGWWQVVVCYVVPVLAGLTLVLTVIGIVVYIRRRRHKTTTAHKTLEVKDVMKKPRSGKTVVYDSTYTLPASITSNCYASLRKLPTPITPHTPGTLTLPHTHTPTHIHVTASLSLTPCSGKGDGRDAFGVSKDSGRRRTLDMKRDKGYRDVNDVSEDRDSWGVSEVSRDKGCRKMCGLSEDRDSRGISEVSKDRGYRNICGLNEDRHSTGVSEVSRDSGCRDTCQSSGSHGRSEVIVDPIRAEMQGRFRQMQVERQRVRLTAVVQEGSYGQVLRGWIQRECPEPDQEVVIKTVKDDAPREEVVALYREGTHLLNLHHRNVLTVLGVSLAQNSSPFLIYPRHHHHNNLKQYLQEQRGGHLRAAEVVDLALQAAHGLAFLHTASVVHGDIAARNCVVSDNLELRLSDAALSRDLFPGDYESMDGDVARPIKWMALEAITERLVSTASDVWSFGVLVWELTTLAQQPYTEVSWCEMAEYLRHGYRLAQPVSCPDHLYEVIAFCWAVHPHHRPHANLILDYLAAFHKHLHTFI